MKKTITFFLCISILLLCFVIVGCQRTQDIQKCNNILFNDVDSIILLGIDFSILTVIDYNKQTFMWDYNSMIRSKDKAANSCCLRGESMDSLLVILDNLDIDSTLVQENNEYEVSLKKNGQYLLLYNDPLDVRCLILLYSQKKNIPIWTSESLTYCDGKYYVTSSALKNFIGNNLRFSVP